MTTSNLRKLFRRQGELGIWIPPTSSADYLAALPPLLAAGEVREDEREPRLFRITLSTP